MVDRAAYERDPRRRLLETEIVATGVEEGRPYAVLSDTLFYPEGGGQPADHGFLAAAAVIDVQRRSGEIRHYLDRPVATGPVEARLAWPRRFDHMQQHTAQHLLSAVAADRYGWETTAFHLGRETSDVELATPVLDARTIGELEEAVATEVRAARAVRARWIDADRMGDLVVRSRGLPAGHRGPVRLVEIDGIDLSTCGGTHLASTAEIEAVALLAAEPMRGGVRLSWVAGGRVRRRLAAQEARGARLRTLLGVPDEEIAAAVEERLAEVQEGKRRFRELADAHAGALVERLASGGPLVELHLAGDYGAGMLRRLAEAVRSRGDARVAFLTAEVGVGGLFALAASEPAAVDLAAVGAAVAELLGGRGGGGRGIYQGKVRDLSRRREALDLVRRALAEEVAVPPPSSGDSKSKGLVK